MEFVHDLTNMCPVTKLYRSGDDYYAVCCADFYTAKHTEVFLADEQGQIIDADGDPANGLTALVRWDEEMDHAEAIQRLEQFLAG